MAYVKVKSSNNASASLTYGTYKSGKKRENVIVDAINCTPETAKDEFALVRNLWGKTDGIQAHTIIQSFAEGEVTMQEANEIGIETAKRLIGDEYQVVVYTQCDGKSRLKHNHINFNAINLKNGKKYDNHALLWRAREISDEICRERGLSVIPHDQPTKAEKALKSRGVKLWKDKIRDIIDQAKAQSNNIDEFKAILRSEGITINERNSRKECGTAWTYVISRTTHKDWGLKANETKIRGRTLGGNYTCASISNFVSENIKMIQKENNLESVLKMIATKQIDDAAKLFFKINQNDKEFMRYVTLIHGTNKGALKSAVEAVTDLKNESQAFGSKFLNDTLKSKEYNIALRSGGQGILSNLVDKITGKGENWGGLSMYVKKLDLDDWNQLSESEKADRLAHQAMDRY